MMTTDAAQALTIYFFTPYIEQHLIVSRRFARVFLHFCFKWLEEICLLVSHLIYHRFVIVYDGKRTERRQRKKKHTHNF